MNTFDLLRLDDLAEDELCDELDKIGTGEYDEVDKAFLAIMQKDMQEAEVELDEVMLKGGKPVKRK